MARETPTRRTSPPLGRLRELADGIGKGPEKDPTKGTKNPFTENLKPKEPNRPAETPSA